MTEETQSPNALLTHVPVQVIVAGKPYTYKAGLELQPLYPRDHVIVSFGTKGLTLGIVESVNQIPLDPNAKYQYKWIIAKVDLAPGQALIEQRTDAEAVARGAAAGVE